MNGRLFTSHLTLIIGLAVVLAPAGEQFDFRFGLGLTCNMRSGEFRGPRCVGLP